MKQCFLFCAFILCFSVSVPGQERDTTASGWTVWRENITVNKIVITGNKNTRRRVILRELSILEGSTINATELDEVLELNRKRLLNLAIFTDVSLAAEKVNDSTADLHIRVKEQWYIMPEVSFQLADRNFNVWWKEQNRDIRRANIGVSLKHRNFRGNLEVLSGTGQIGYTQKYGLEYFKPYVDKKQQHGLGASFFFSKNGETFYNTSLNKYQFLRIPGDYILRRFEAATIYVYRPGYAAKHLFELRYRDYNVKDTIVKLNPDYFEGASANLKMLDLSYRYELNKVDNWNYPMTGFKAVGNVAVRAGWEGFNFQTFAKIEAAQFYKLKPKWYTASIFRGRLMYPEKQPYTFRYALGLQPDYVRGYEYYVIDGSQFGLLRNDLKFELLNTVIRNIPIKYLPVIPFRLYPKIYADVGYVTNKFPGNSFLNNRLLYSAGAGFDIITAYDFKLRVEYTWNHLGEKGLFLHMNSE